MLLKKSFEQLKHIERISRQTRHHRTHLNQAYNQKLDEQLNHLTSQFEQTFKRIRNDKKLEQQRKQILGITIQQIEHEKEGRLLSKQINIPQISSTKRSSCRLFSQNCQLYPCQPIRHYTSFIGKEHDQTLIQRNSSSPLVIQENRRQLAFNQQHLAHRHRQMKRTKSLLDEQSRLLHERLNDKKSFAYIKDERYELKQDIQRHLNISAKFCG